MSHEFIPYSSDEALAGRAYAHKRHPRVSIRTDILMRYADETQKLMKGASHLGFVEASRRVMAGKGSREERQAYASALGHMMNERQKHAHGVRETAAAEYRRRAHG